MHMTSRRTAAFTIALIILCALPAFAFAAGGGFVPLTKDFNGQKLFGVGGGSGSSPQDLTSFINAAFKVVLSIGAILAVLRIAYAGWQYMSSDAWGEKSHAKEILGDVIIGLLLLLSVYLILNQINPQITKLNIEYVTEKAKTK